MKSTLGEVVIQGIQVNNLMLCGIFPAKTAITSPRMALVRHVMYHVSLVLQLVLQCVEFARMVFINSKIALVRRVMKNAELAMGNHLQIVLVANQDIN